MNITRQKENINEVLGILQTVLKIEGTEKDFDLSPEMLDAMFYFDNEKNPCFVIENRGKYDIKAIAEGKIHTVKPSTLMYEIDVKFPVTIEMEIISDL